MEPRRRRGSPRSSRPSSPPGSPRPEKRAARLPACPPPRSQARCAAASWTGASSARPALSPPAPAPSEGTYFLSALLLRVSPELWAGGDAGVGGWGRRPRGIRWAAFTQPPAWPAPASPVGLHESCGLWLHRRPAHPLLRSALAPHPAACP